jgi:hypothetical protein
LKFHGVTADPTDAENGDVIYRSDTNSFRFYQNSAWAVPLYATLTDTQIPFGNSSGGLSQSANLVWDGILKVKSAADASLGSELITLQADRDFSGAGNWTGTDWTISGGAYVHVAGANDATLAGYAATIGNAYLITVTIKTTTAGGLTVRYGNASASAVGDKVETLSSYTVVLTATTTGGLVISPNTQWAGSIDNVSIKLITPNAASVTFKNAAGVSGIETRAVNSTSFGIGLNALKHNIAGINNTASGVEALYSNMYGQNGTAFGSQALKSNTTGNSNTAIGTEAMLSNTSGYGNTAIGMQALATNTTGLRNIANGAFALLSNRTGNDNTATGKNALYTHQTGDGNTANGMDALYNNRTGSNNTAIGKEALRSGGFSGSSNCIALGSFAGRYNINANGKLYIDAFNRTNTAGDDAGAIITGTMSATVADHTLRFNALTSVYNDLRLMGATSGYVGLKGAADAGSTTYTWPAADGTTDQVLKTDGSGTLGWATGGGSDITVSAISSSLNPAVYGTAYLVDTTAAISITLPAPSANKWIRVKDYIGTGAGTNNITIVRNGSEKIDNVAASFVIDSDKQSILIVSDGTDWAIL